MKKTLCSLLCSAVTFAVVLAQAPQRTPPPADDEVIRISAELVQVDAVVTDKNDRIIGDLKLEDFEVYESGKKQEIKFLEFISVDAERRSEGARPPMVAEVETDTSRDLTGAELKRVIAFVIDDLTIPYEDMISVRRVLSDFVENKMRDGDLVAILRSVGGRGLLQQFTSDRQLLRRAIASLTPRTNPFSAFNADSGRMNNLPTPTGGTTTDPGAFNESLAGIDSSLDAEGVGSGSDITNENDDSNRTFRALMALSTAGFAIDSLQQIPGRKNLVLISGGLPLFEIGRGGGIVSNVSYLFNQLADQATRSGVAINTLDIRGLETQGAVARFVDTPAKSALGGGTLAGDDLNPAFGRTADTALLGDRPFGQFEGQLGLRALAEATGGVAVVNTNNFNTGLDKILARSRGYYRLAYRPTEKFDGKFHKLQIKVRRDGARVYNPEGYVARAARGAAEASTKEASILRAAKSPLAKREVDVSANFLLKYTSDHKAAALDMHLLIDANKLNFKQTADGKHQTTFDVVGFVFDQLGRSRGGFSETVNANLSPESYRKALAEGLSYSASTQLPPGYYQIRAVVREADTGNLGTLSKYYEIPDLTNKRLTMSSLFLYGVNPTGGDKPALDALLASHRISRKQDLRYAALIYNAKLKDNKPQLRSQLIISQNNKVLFQEPEQPLEATAGSGSPVSKVGQLGLSKVQPGRYVLTLVVIDPLADKKHQRVSRSVGFTVVD